MANKKSSEMTDVLKQGVLGEKSSKKPASSGERASVASSGSVRYALERFWGKVLRLDAPVWVSLFVVLLSALLFLVLRF
jgi:hypothetical protein